MKNMRLVTAFAFVLLLYSALGITEEKKMPPKKSGSVPSAPSKPAAPSSTGQAETLERSTIFGDRELPNVMYIVPWKRPEMGDMATKPVKSLLDETIAPLDRDVFQREIRFFDELHDHSAVAAQKHQHD